MKLRPIYSAVLAAGYIASLVVGIHTGIQFFGETDNLLMPVVMLSLLVLSVAVMGFLFFYQPTLLLLDGKHSEAVRYFIHTIAFFAAIIVVLLIISLTISNLPTLSDSYQVH